MFPILAEDGARLLAISPERAEGVDELRLKRELPFPMLVDNESTVADAYGLRWVFPEDLREVYRSFGLDLGDLNHDPTWSMPIPGQFIIDPSGVIRHATCEPDYTKRPEPEDLTNRFVRLANDKNHPSK